MSKKKKKNSFDHSLDGLLTAQVENMDPRKRAKAEAKLKRDKEKVYLLSNLTQGQLTESARTSLEAWFDTIQSLQKADRKSSKKDRKRNKKYLAQVTATAMASSKGWQLVAEGRAKNAIKD